MWVGRESARGWMRASVAADVRTHWLARSRSRCARAGRALVAKAHSLTARRSREYAPLAREPRKRTCPPPDMHISAAAWRQATPAGPYSADQPGLRQPRFHREATNGYAKPKLIRTHACQSLSRVCSGRGFGSPPRPTDGGAPAAPAGPRPPGQPGLCQSWLNIEPEKSLLSQDWHEPMLFQLRAGPLRPGAPQGPRLTDRGLPRRLGDPRAAGPTRPISILA